MLFLHRWNRRAGARRPVRNIALLSIAGGVLAACGGGNWGSGKDASAQYRACLNKVSALYRYSGSFDGYLSKAKKIGRRCGIRSSTLHAGLGRLNNRNVGVSDYAEVDGIELREQIADATGADGVLLARRRGGNAVRDYLDYRVTPDLVRKGRSMRKRYRRLLRQIERRYRVPAHYLVAFWASNPDTAPSPGATASCRPSPNSAIAAIAGASSRANCSARS